MDTNITVISSETPTSVFLRQVYSGYNPIGFRIWTNSDRSARYAVGRMHGADWDKAPTFPTVEAAFERFPQLLAWCEAQAKIPTWMDHLRAAIARAAISKGWDITALEFEGASLDRTWGDKHGIVFWGGSPEVNQGAAALAEQWFRDHGATFKLFGGYDAQQSVGLCGLRYYARFSNGASGWYRDPVKPRSEDQTPALVETREGVSVSYVYYPCAD